MTNDENYNLIMYFVLRLVFKEYSAEILSSNPKNSQKLKQKLLVKIKDEIKLQLAKHLHSQREKEDFLLLQKHVDEVYHSVFEGFVAELAEL